MSRLFDDIADMTDHQVAMTIGAVRPPKLPPRHGHPVARQFPSMGAADYERLKADIRLNGQKRAVAMYQGYIWEGRARYDACVELGLIPKVFVLRTRDPVLWLLARQHARYGEPSTSQRTAALKVLSEIDSSAWKKQEREIRADWIKEARTDFNKAIRVQGRCEVCGLRADYSHAHHLIPLTLQYDLGLYAAQHDHSWLCPVHHKLIHRMISTLVLGTRGGSFYRDQRFADRRAAAEHAAAFKVYDKGLALFERVGGFQRFGNWSLLQ